MKFGSTVQIVLQDTAIFSTEDHPIHLHGYHFYVVGEGFGNFNPSTDTAKFNLVDPPQRNTIDVNVGGWAVIRFKADNPGNRNDNQFFYLTHSHYSVLFDNSFTVSKTGVWLMHCHIDSHLTWGLAMAFIVEDGYGESESVEPPPADLPPC